MATDKNCRFEIYGVSLTQNGYQMYSILPFAFSLFNTMVAKSVGTQHTFSTFLSSASPSLHTMLIYFETWVTSLKTGVKFVQPNVLSSQLKIVPGGEGAIVVLYRVIYYERF